MPLFPVFLDLAARPCLVVGGGPVGCRKARALAEAGAEVTVVDPAPSAELEALAEEQGEPAAGRSGATPRIKIVGRAFEHADCEGRALVFACTGRPEVDAAVAAAAARAGSLFCLASSAGERQSPAGTAAGARSSAAGEAAVAASAGSPLRFTTGALLRREPLCLAVSSSGAAPRLAAAARDLAAATIGDSLAGAAALLHEGRPAEALALLEAAARAAAGQEGACTR